MTIIAAITRDGAIGRGGDVIYHISADLKRFKQLTMGRPVVMGRRTYESLPSGPLPGRRNLVVSRRGELPAPQNLPEATTLELCPSLAEALASAGQEAMVIGGGQIYAQAMPLADRLEITEIDAEAPEADTFFPAIGPAWLKTSETPWQTDPRSGARFRYASYQRR